MDDAMFASLLEKARTGDAAAFEELLNAFQEDVRMIVRAILPKVLRSQYDSLDFTQCVWASVLPQLQDGEEAFSDPKRFRAYLAGIARNKVFAEFRKRTRTYKYDLKRQEPLYFVRGGVEREIEVFSNDPTPSARVQASDQARALVRGRGERPAMVLRLLQEGLNYVEIAERLGIHERTVRRAVDEFRIRLAASETG